MEEAAPVTLRAVLIETEEGVAVFCPARPGCASQGATEAEALDAIREAAALWLDAGGTPAPDGGRAAETDVLREAADDGLKATVREVETAAVAA